MMMDCPMSLPDVISFDFFVVMAANSFFSISSTSSLIFSNLK
jgi:hypothetical protein